MMIHDRILETETGIVWLEDPMQYEYLREGYSLVPDPDSPLPNVPLDHVAKVVGYSVVAADPDLEKMPRDKRVYLRRFWWLKDYDRGLDPDGVYADGFPAEAVDPASVRCGERSA